MTAVLTAPPVPGDAATASLGHRCPVCDRPLPGRDAACRNPLCASASRWFRWSVAAAERSGPLEAALNAYKYAGVRTWAPVFGRLLAELMERRRRLFEPFDLITASPTFVGRGGHDFDHTRLILLETAGRRPGGRSWPLDTGPVAAIVKTEPTPRLAPLGHRQRRRVAEEQLRHALHIPDRGRIAGRRILVVDDVFTDGRTLDEVARALRLQGGAREVCGLALCRQPWHDRAGPESTRLKRS